MHDVFKIEKLNKNAKAGSRITVTAVKLQDIIICVRNPTVLQASGLKCCNCLKKVR